MYVQGLASTPGAFAAPVDLTTGTAVAVLELSTGATAWHEIGADLCPFDLGFAADKRRSVVPICRYAAGTRTFTEHAGSRPTRSYSGAVAALVGVDVRSGEDRWTVDLPSEAFEHDHRFGSLDGTAAVPSAEGLLLVDLFSGETTPSGPDDVFACFDDREPYTPVTLRAPDGDVPYSIGIDVSPCDARGDPVPEFSAGAAAAGGIPTDDGGWIVGTVAGPVRIDPA